MNTSGDAGSGSAQGGDCEYIIVGGGTAGCVAAWRLVTETDARVVLLETGADYTSPYLKLSPGYSRLVPKGVHCTLHQTVPQAHAGNRVLEIATGRVLGGGSSVNAQVYMRGYRADYDQWGSSAGSGLWSWETMLPHFRRLEGNQKYSGEFHGCAGPLTVADPGFFCEYSHLFVKAGQTLGLPFTADFNVGAPAGTGYLQFTARGGRRCSAAEAFLGKVRSNPRLRVVTGAQVNRVLLDHKRAVGIEYLRGGRKRTLQCTREVLLAAGALASPKVLMLSGIGPAEQLRRLDIPVLVDLPGVGQNLHDHAGSPLVLAGNSRGYGYFRQDKGSRLVWNLLEYGLFRRGRLTTVGGEASSFHTTSESSVPTVQIYCVPMIGYSNTGADTVPDVDGIKLHVTLLRPHSRGSLSLRSADPAALPLVDPNYLADGRDLKNLVEGMRIGRELAATAPLSQELRGELLPGVAIQDDAAIANYIRSTVRTDWHPVGTCRMGRSDDPMSVVSETLGVHGVEGLRVIDASVMPNIISANTNAPTMALADRGISLLLSGGTTAR
ncbi:MAG TPA: GMC family oxidoreductase N-terminal domain-containing protein [Steroidobacteraceae bacterium]|nr:GMC family oxidoreductase N-terminal domain-containing protein [Steroidobacteraceae bacterium]